MKIIVTHISPDWDALASVWLVKRFLPNWSEAEVRFVPAGERIKGSVGNSNLLASELPANSYAVAGGSNIHLSRESKSPPSHKSSPRLEPPEYVVEQIDGNEIIHVDTGLGALDHHRIESEDISATSLTFNFILRQSSGQVINEEKKQALDRMIKVIVEVDHFKEVNWDNPTADYHEFSFLGILEGLKLERPNDDLHYINFGMETLDAILHNFENRIWAEKEIKEKGLVFETKWGKGIGIETINDSVLKLAQKMGYVVVVRRDPRKGYIRIKARPLSESQKSKVKSQKLNIDLTGVYEKLKKMDPEATWFLHVSKKMLLNGTTKNPKMRPTKLGLSDIIRVLETI